MVDDHSRFCSGKIVHALIPEACVARFLDGLPQLVGFSQEMILDNGPEGTSKAMFDWPEQTGVRSRFKGQGKTRAKRLRGEL